jgi:predicted MFS family arabinose efflux permease
MPGGKGRRAPALAVEFNMASKPGGVKTGVQGRWAQGMDGAAARGVVLGALSDQEGTMRDSNAGLRRLVWSNLAAQSAEQVALAAVPLAAVLALGAGVAQTGLLAVAQTLPFLLLSLPLGLLADRVSRPRLMVAAELLRAVALAALPVLAAFGLLSIPVLAAIGFATATGTVAFSVAAPALVPALVAHGRTGEANARLELARSMAFAAGPAVAGMLVAWSGAPPAFALAASLSLCAALLLRGIAEPKRAALPNRHVLRELQEGATFLWGHPLLRPVLLTAVAWNLSWFVLQAAYVPYAVSVLGLSAAGVGATLAAYGVGMVAGALLSPRLSAALPFGTTVGFGPVVSVAAGAAVAATVAWPSAWLAGVGFFLFGAGPIVWTINQTTLRQAVTPGAMLGRASALMMMATYGARPLGAALGGYLGEVYGPSSCLLLAAIGFCVQAVVIFASPVCRLQRLPEPARALAGEA